jgi:hypothetical protein
MLGDKKIDDGAVAELKPAVSCRSISPSMTAIVFSQSHFFPLSVAC